MTGALGVVRVDGALGGAAGDERAAVALHAHVADGAAVRLDHLRHLRRPELAVQDADITCVQICTRSKTT